MGFISDELAKRKIPALPEMDKDDFEKTRKEIVEYVWKIFLAAVASRWCRVRPCDGSITPL
jgi:hypothetical protein